jgi:hypothetical protein
MYVEGGVLQFRSFLSLTLVKVNGQPHAPADVFPGKEPKGTLSRRLSGKHTRSGRFGKEKKFLPLAGILNPDRLTHKWFNKIYDM